MTNAQILVNELKNEIDITYENDGLNKIKGTYRPADGRFIIKAKIRLYDNNESNLIHELGHHFYFTRLSPEGRKNWFAIYEKYIKACKGKLTSECFISNYAAKNAEEDFAECFKVYYYDRNALNKFSDREQYFKGIIG